MPQDLVSDATAILEKHWSRISTLAEQGELNDWLPDPLLLTAIRAVINSKTKTYRYVLVTQLIAKLADSTLDALCLQRTRGGQGAFDARTVAHGVVVPFDQKNDRVLGGSVEPYVSNPLRVPEISEVTSRAQRNQADWNHIYNILRGVEDKQNVTFTESVLNQVLTEVYRRLKEIRVVYPIPRRISLENCLRLLQLYLSVRSGGDRLLALTSALFVVIGQRFRLYTSVRRGNITAADQATGLIADLECLLDDGTVVLAVEVKDRQLSVSQLSGKIPSFRERQVAEAFFVAQGVVPQDQEEIESVIQHEYASGHNIYVLDLRALANVLFALFGESGRREFLMEVGNQLEEYRSDVSHRRTWAELLRSV